MRTDDGVRAACPRCGRDDARFCCAGCVLAASMPRDADGNFPVSRPLVTALAAGFLLFNQALFAALRWLVPPNEPGWDPRLLLGSFAAGTLAWSLLAVAQVRSTGLRAPELLVMAATAALLICAWIAGNALLGIVAAGAWAVWTVRGLLRRKSVAL